MCQRQGWWTGQVCYVGGGGGTACSTEFSSALAEAMLVARSRLMGEQGPAFWWAGANLWREDRGRLSSFTLGGA